MNPFNKPNDSLKVSASPTPLAEHTAMRLTAASQKESVTSLFSANIPPGGTYAKGHNSSVNGTGMQYSHQDGKDYVGSEAKGKVVIPSNHPNKKLNKIYG